MICNAPKNTLASRLKSSRKKTGKEVEDVAEVEVLS